MRIIQIGHPALPLGIDYTRFSLVASYFREGQGQGDSQQGRDAYLGFYGLGSRTTVLRSAKGRGGDA